MLVDFFAGYTEILQKDNNHVQVPPDSMLEWRMLRMG